MSQNNQNEIIIDGAGSVLGRLASYAAKQALLGKSVIIVNCSDIILSGKRRMIIEEYKNAVLKGGHSLKGPFWVKRNPERLAKRTVRGMLSYRQKRGQDAFSRIKCYNAVPEKYRDSKKVSLTREAKSSIKLSHLAEEL